MSRPSTRATIAGRVGVGVHPDRVELRILCLKEGCRNTARYGEKRFCGIHAAPNLKRDSDIEST